MLKAFMYEKFKSFDKAILWLEQLTTMIGTNASGKSNAVEGIQILSGLAIGRDLNAIFDETFNPENIVRGGAKGCCRFGAQSFTLGCIGDYDQEFDLLYRITIGVNGRTTIHSEEMYMIRSGKTDASGATMIFKTRRLSDSDDLMVEYSAGTKENSNQIKCIRNYSALSQILGKLPETAENYQITMNQIRLIREDLSRVFILDPIPSMMRGYSRIGDEVLRRNCSNISSVLYHLYKGNRGLWSQFENIVQTMPENEIKEIFFVKTILNDVILVQKEETGNSFANVDAARLSDGTLRCIAVLAAAMSVPEGSIIAIEELDNGIHPGRVNKLLYSLTEIARQRHVDLIITTHNVALLNDFRKEDIIGVSVVYRDAVTKASRIIPFLDVRNQAGMLAMGGIGSALKSDVLLRSIKEKHSVKPFNFMD